jgi:hypothetical protein
MNKKREIIYCCGDTNGIRLNGNSMFVCHLDLAQPLVTANVL